MVNAKETERKRVADTDVGKEIQEEIDDLKLLLNAYKEGKIKLVVLIVTIILVIVVGIAALCKKSK